MFGASVPYWALLFGWPAPSDRWRRLPSYRLPQDLPNDWKPEARGFMRWRSPRGPWAYYWDEAQVEFVIVVPADGSSSFEMSDAAWLGVPVRVETREITPGRVAQVLAALERARGVVDGGYAFFFDPRSGHVVLQAEAERTAFQSVDQAFPGLVE